MSDPSGRVLRVDAPIVSPGNCAICGTVNHPLGFVDPRLDFEFYGTLYLCADCVGECARIFGFLSPSEVAGLREHIEAQDDELNTLRQATHGLESTVDSLIADAHRRSTERAERIKRNRDKFHDDVLVSDPVDEPDAGQADGSVTESVEVQPVPDNRPVEPRDERGRDNLFDTSSADELLGL